MEQDRMRTQAKAAPRHAMTAVARAPQAAASSTPAPAGEVVDLGQLTGSLGFLLRMAQIEAFSEFYKNLPEPVLKPGQFSVLSVIGLNPGIRQGVLAQKLKIKKAHMTKLVRELEDRDLVRRTVPDGDRRAVELALTEEGRGFVARHRGHFYGHEAFHSVSLAPAEREQLASLLRKYLGLEAAERPGGAKA